MAKRKANTTAKKKTPAKKAKPKTNLQAVRDFDFRFFLEQYGEAHLSLDSFICRKLYKDFMIAFEPFFIKHQPSFMEIGKSALELEDTELPGLYLKSTAAVAFCLMHEMMGLDDVITLEAEMDGTYIYRDTDIGVIPKGLVKENGVTDEECMVVPAYVIKVKKKSEGKKKSLNSKAYTKLTRHKIIEMDDEDISTMAD